MAKIFVTGSRGYLGSAITSALKDAGHQVETLTGRLHEIEPASLDFECVVHCAGALRHRTGEHELANGVGTQRLLSGLRKKNARVIYLSSRGVYLPEGTELTEDSPLEPSDDYGRTKLAGERSTSNSEHSFLILRLSGVFGVGQENAGISFPTRAAERFLQGDVVTLHLPPRNHDYIYVQDLARWMSTFVKEGPHWGQIYNVAGPVRPLDELVQQIADEVYAQTKLSADIRRQSGPPPMAPEVDTSKLRQAFPQLNTTSAEDVVRELVSFLRSR